MNVEPNKLKELLTEIFLLAGASSKYAEIIADTLVQADLRGISSHGVSRVPIYLKRIKLGLVSAAPTIKIINDSPTTAILDGNYGLGQITAYEAMNLAISKAEASNVGLVGVKKSHHFGATYYYTMMAVRKDMIGFACSNTTPLMAAPGGAKRIVGNNPFSFAIPAEKQLPIVLDMACSIVAQGKIMVARNKGEKIPEGWALDVNGSPTRDPVEALKGCILPVGGPKGYGLAVIVDILAGVLTGANFGSNVTSIYNDLQNKQDSGHFMAALKISSFMNVDDFKQRVDQLIYGIKESQLAPDSKEIFIPGEIEFKNAIRNKIKGITLPMTTYNELQKASIEMGMNNSTFCKYFESN